MKSFVIIIPTRDMEEAKALKLKLDPSSRLLLTLKDDRAFLVGIKLCEMEIESMFSIIRRDIVLVFELIG